MDLLLIANPRAAAATPLWPAARTALDALGALRLTETAGDGDDGARIAAALAVRPDVVVAAGGDGTLRAVAAGLMRLPAGERPALAILPLGTANNVARSLGLLAVRQRGTAAIARTADAIRGGRTQALDLGRVNGEWFVGSFALGMDAAILATRNRWRARWRLGPRLGGYPLYLASCAANLVSHTAVGARLTADGSVRSARVYNLLVANTALYAGEFRFDADDHSGDGRLDLHLLGGAVEYVHAFVAAWRRHLAHERGAVVAPPPLERIRELVIECDAPLPSQLDGEEGPRGSRFEVVVEPGALRVVI